MRWLLCALGAALAGVSVFALEAVIGWIAVGRPAVESPASWAWYAGLGAALGAVVGASRRAGLPLAFAVTFAAFQVVALLERAWRLADGAGLSTGAAAAIAGAAVLIASCVLALLALAGRGWIGLLAGGALLLGSLSLQRLVAVDFTSPSAAGASLAALLAAVAVCLAARRSPRAALGLLVAGASITLFVLDTRFQVRGDAETSLARPHLLLVIVDTLRADVFEDVVDTTAEGRAFRKRLGKVLWFSNLVAVAPWTTPSVGSILSGRYPKEHGMELDPSSPLLFGVHELDPSVPTLAQRLGDHGYRSVAVVTNGFLHSRSGVSRGFDEYQMLRGPSLVHPLLEPGEQLGWLPVRAYEPAENVTAYALRSLPRWLREQSPLFVWLHYMEPHKPLRKHSALSRDPRGASLSTHARRYRDEVRHVLRETTRVIDAWKAAGVWEHTAFIFTSDHGELFRSDQHPVPLEEGGRRWEGHGHALYEPLLHVPLVVRPPPGLEVPHRTGQLASHVDLWPTIGDLLGVELPPATDGARSLLRNDAGADRAVLAGSVNSGPDQRALRTRRFKWIEHPGTDRAPELYDLSADPEERTNLADVDTERAEELRTRLDRRWGDLDLAHRRDRIKMDARTVERLRRLGYLE